MVASKRIKQFIAVSIFLLLIIENVEARGNTREYFITAEDVVWDFAPSNQNLLHCMHVDGPCDIPEPWTNSHVFNKIRYIQYTDATYAVKVEQPAWLGILGPIIRAEVGDKVIIHFCNKSESGGAYGMHPHGFRYSKDDEGATYRGVNNGTQPGAGAEIPPGGCHDYTWYADKDSGPGKAEVSSKVWWYHSHVDEPAETNAGLLGPIIITARGMAKADASPVDVDQEFVTAFFIFDEMAGEEPGLMHSINGYIFGNLTGLVAKNGDKVRWHVLGMGNEVDIHTPHWHGKTLSIGAKDFETRTDVVNILPATMITADMKADNPGEWLFHCHVADHIYAGMATSYQILP